MPNFTLRRERKQTRYFTEPLGDNLGLAMVLIPGGTFTMGSPPNEPERMDREGPQHEVSIPSYFMGRYPVTQAQWRFVAELSSVNRALEPNPAHFEGEQHPVEQVSWDEAVEFCDRLSAHTQRNYRLPTEAEWEYACRAGTTTSFYFGQILTTEVANYNGSHSYNDSPTGENRQTTTPVDHFSIANGFGLCDMHGNVWEWCQDVWQPGYGSHLSKRKTEEDFHSDQTTHHVARGGSWYSPPQRCRSASRLHFQPESCHSDLGFRVICCLN